MEAKVEVDETDVPGLTVGDSASVKVDAFPNQAFPGRVTRIGNSSIQLAAAGGQSTDQQSVDYEVVITLDNPPAELRPDLSATAEIVTETRANALSVPILALTVRDAEGKKFRVEDDDEKDAPQAAVRGPRRRGRDRGRVRGPRRQGRVGAGDHRHRRRPLLRGGARAARRRDGGLAAATPRCASWRTRTPVQVPVAAEKGKDGEKDKAKGAERRKG